MAGESEEGASSLCVDVGCEAARLDGTAPGSLATVHVMPFETSYDGPARVSSFFAPGIGKVDGESRGGALRAPVVSGMGESSAAGGAQAEEQKQKQRDLYSAHFRGREVTGRALDVSERHPHALAVVLTQRAVETPAWRVSHRVGAVYMWDVDCAYEQRAGEEAALLKWMDVAAAMHKAV